MSYMAVEGWPWDKTSTVPLYCPRCGRPLIPHAWATVNEDREYRSLRCDGAIGAYPGLGKFWRRLAFDQGSHYTWELGPFPIANRPEYDRLTGAIKP